MPSKKLLLLLTCGLPALGILVTVALIARAMSAFSDLAFQSNVTPEEMKIQVGVITQRLSMAAWPASVGLAGGVAGLILLAVRARRTPPAAPTAAQATNQSPTQDSDSSPGTAGSGPAP